MDDDIGTRERAYRITPTLQTHQELLHALERAGQHDRIRTLLFDTHSARIVRERAGTIRAPEYTANESANGEQFSRPHITIRYQPYSNMTIYIATTDLTSFPLQLLGDDTTTTYHCTTMSDQRYISLVNTVLSARPAIAEGTLTWHLKHSFHDEYPVYESLITHLAPLERHL